MLSGPTAELASRGHGTPLVEDPARLAGVRAVGVDETAFLKANRGFLRWSQHRLE